MSDFLSLILRMFCFYPIGYGDKAKGRLATCPFCFAGLPSVLFCWYACNSFSLLEITDGTIHFSTSLSSLGVSTWRKNIDFSTYTIKKKRNYGRICSFSLQCACCFNFIVPALAKEPHNMWRWNSKPRVLKYDPESFIHGDWWGKPLRGQTLVYKKKKKN